MFAATVQTSEYLPSINSTVETARLGYGSMIRLCLHSAAFYGTKGAISELVLGRSGALDVCERDAIVYVLSMAGEVGVSLLWSPVRYLAAVNTPRFLLDYLLTSWSETLRWIDGFHPGRFASYALYAFTSTSSGEEWDLNFFSWQVPSILLTLGKLFTRRRRLGKEKCRTKRVLAVLFLQVFFRAYMATFSTMVPEQNSEAFEAMFTTMVEGLCTAYLARHTWPFSHNETISLSSSGSNGGGSKASTPSESTPAEDAPEAARSPVAPRDTHPSPGAYQPIDLD